jgi:hypothetical protein
MREACTETNGNAAGDVRSSEIGSLTQSRRPHDYRPNNSDDKLGSGDKPMGMNHIGCLFIVNVVERITCWSGMNQKRELTSINKGTTQLPHTVPIFLPAYQHTTRNACVTKHGEKSKEENGKNELDM